MEARPSVNLTEQVIEINKTISSLENIKDVLNFADMMICRIERPEAKEVAISSEIKWRSFAIETISDRLNNFKDSNKLDDLIEIAVFCLYLANNEEE